MTDRVKSADVAGVVAAVACAAHCAAGPLLLVVLPASPLFSERAEWGFVVASALLGSLAMYGGMRRHGQLRPAMLLAFGVGTLLVARLTAERRSAELMAVACAATLLVLAHLDNRRQCARCRST